MLLLRDVRSRRGENPSGNVESILMSVVKGRGIDWCRLGPCCWFDVNIYNNRFYPQRVAPTVPLFHSLILSSSIFLVKIKVRKGDVK